MQQRTSEKNGGDGKLRKNSGDETSGEPLAGKGDGWKQIIKCREKNNNLKKIRDF